MEGEVRLEPGSLRKLIMASKTWDAVSRREMRKGLRTAALIGAEAAKSSVLGPPPANGRTRNRRSTGLRSGLAAGVKVSIRTGREASDGTVTGEGVRIVTTDAKLPDSKSAMVKAYMAREFRHPVFGTDKYVSQRGKDWFYRPLQAGASRYETAIAEAVQAAAEAIAE